MTEPQTREAGRPIQLSASQHAEIESWANDDRLWETRSHRLFNLVVLARKLAALSDGAREGEWKEARDAFSGIRRALSEGKRDLADAIAAAYEGEIEQRFLPAPPEPTPRAKE